jgi:hypothetical protein
MKETAKMDDLTSTIVGYAATELADAIAAHDENILGPTDSGLCERALRFYAAALLRGEGETPPELAEAA